ncbi:hypothetical protein F4810DRAFT_198752 [Camillea tinctor]|nr:hypothetical protein F4810DRAFT_198752 [Camillea tinctor]
MCDSRTRVFTRYYCVNFSSLAMFWPINPNSTIQYVSPPSLLPTPTPNRRNHELWTHARMLHSEHRNCRAVAEKSVSKCRSRLQVSFKGARRDRQRYEPVLDLQYKRGNWQGGVCQRMLYSCVLRRRTRSLKVVVVNTKASEQPAFTNLSGRAGLCVHHSPSITSLHIMSTSPTPFPLQTPGRWHN